MTGGDTFSPARYWERRYLSGRSSGSGSQGAVGKWKADFVSDYIKDNKISTVVDWGCGDGQVLAAMDLPEGTDYTGLDVSRAAVDRMKAHYGRFPGHSHTFETVDRHDHRRRFDMALSMDVLFHFPDDDDYHAYLAALFSSASGHVLIYSTDTDDGRTAHHVRRRAFTPDVSTRYPQWAPMPVVPGPEAGGGPNMYIYRNLRGGGSGDEGVT